ncbi:MAG TPA: geranylgeranyl reductase family protein [Streptosporangiaceae bacterium]
MAELAVWDVAVVGAGPAGLTAALAAAAAGARTVVIERAEHPRYKTCGGGLIGTSLAAAGRHVQVPARDTIHTITAALNGRREFTRHDDAPLLAMVSREEFDDALRKAAAGAGVTLRQHATVRGISEDGGLACARLADGTSIRARVLVGADGSSGVSSRYVGVRFQQVDLGLELEIPVPPPVAAQWQERVMLDWGPMPGSYGWVFPKGDLLTVGVIAARGQGDQTRRYLSDFVSRLGLAGYPAARDSGHLTHCRADDSPLRRGRVLVAGDAAGLLEPWTREGISFALRSGTLAGAAAADAAAAQDPVRLGQALDAYPAAVAQALVPEMDAGRRLLTAFTRHPAAFHTGLASPKGWHAFARFCRSELPFAALVERRPVRMALSLMSRI